MTNIERIELSELLKENRAALLASIETVREEDFTSKPTENDWSIADVVEHLVLIDKSLVAGILHKAKNLKDTTPETVADGKIFYIVPDLKRGKVVAPAHLKPQSEYQSKTEAITAFNASRDMVEDFVATTKLPLERIAFKHFALGLLNGRSWMVFIVAHCQRHMTQIENIRKERGI